ncbi:MAG: hypothetical protein QW356_03885 [Candidatus Hadarchaeales archaeon]
MAEILETKEAKWYRKAIAGFKELWTPAVKAAASYEAFVKGISAVTGIPESAVRASAPAREWAEFQKNPEAYLPTALAKLEAAHASKKWSVKYKRAFGG